MWRLRTLLGTAVVGLVLTAASLAVAQAPPATLPPNTVWGRLGAGQSGPGQAIPFATLSAQVAGLQNGVFGSGTPWCDPHGYGAIANGNAANITADTAAINRCLSILGALPPGTSGELRLGAGWYCVPGLVVTLPSVVITGVGVYDNGVHFGTFLGNCHVATSPTIELDAADITLRNVTVSGNGLQGGDSFGATQPAILIDAACNQCKLENFTALGGAPPVQNNSGEIQMLWGNIYFSYGAGNFVSTGGGEYTRVSFDSQWLGNSGQPPASGQTLPAWSASLSITSTNSVVTMVGPDSNTYFMQAQSQPCTTGSGSQPTVKNYGNPITDGTCTWFLVYPNGFALYDMNGASENYCIQCDMTGASENGILVQNSSQHISCIECVISQNANNSIYLEGGSDFVLVDGDVACIGIINCTGVYVGSGWSGPTSITNSRNVSPVAFYLGGGTAANITGNYIDGGLYDVEVGAAVSGFIVSNNTLIGGGLGVSVASGASDYYTITGNLCNGVESTCISDSGSGSHKSVYSNDGTAVPVTAGGTGAATAGAARTNLGLGTAATQNTGTSGANVPLLNANNTFSGNNSHTGTETFSSQIIPAYGTPTIASGACGTTTNGTIAAGGTNQSGEVVIASATTTSCVVSFSATLSAAPLACILFPENATAAATGTTVARVSAISTGGFTITGSALASANYYYHCF